VTLTTEEFGRENTGVIYGGIGASHQLGASMAAFGAGASFLVAGRVMSQQIAAREASQRIPVTA
jgi:hypothetical protein